MALNLSFGWKKNELAKRFGMQYSSRKQRTVLTKSQLYLIWKCTAIINKDKMHF